MGEFTGVIVGLIMFIFVCAVLGFLFCVGRALYLTWVWDSLHIWLVALGSGCALFILGFLCKQ